MERTDYNTITVEELKKELDGLPDEDILGIITHTPDLETIETEEGVEEDDN